MTGAPAASVTVNWNFPACPGLDTACSAVTATFSCFDNAGTLIRFSARNSLSSFRNTMLTYVSPRSASVTGTSMASSPATVTTR